MISASLGRRERAHVGPAGGELLEIGLHRRDRGLLEHHLGQPDPIGIGTLALQSAPGQLPFIHNIPAQQGI